MAKKTVVKQVFLNELQLATLALMRKAVNEKGYIDGDLVHNGNDEHGGFKMNVVNALMRRGVVQMFRGRHYRIVPNVDVALFTRKHRTTSKAGIAFAARQAAEQAGNAQPSEEQSEQHSAS